MNEELMQEIKSTIPWFIVAALAVAGYYGFKNYRETRRIESSNSLVASYTTDEFEEAVAKYGTSDAGGALKLRLAKKYFDDGRYDEAIGIYDELAKKAPDGYADIPAVGKAECLEAQAKYADALAAYEGFVEANPKSFLALSANLGACRVIALSGDKAKALAKLAELKASVKDDPVATARIEATEDVINRYTAPAAKVVVPAAPAAAPAK